MSKRNYKLLLEDIFDAIKKIQTYTHKMSFQKFIHDSKTSDAVVRNIEIIGEAASQIPKSIQIQYGSIEWLKIIGARNRIIHEYFGIDFKIVWKIIQDDIPKLEKQISKLLKDL